MSTKQLPSTWQLGDKVQVVFPGNGTLQGKIIKVAFVERDEPLYDVEVPFEHTDYDGDQEAGKKGYFRIHGVAQWFLSYTQEEWVKMREQESDSENTVMAIERNAFLVVSKLCHDNLPGEYYKFWAQISQELKRKTKSIEAIPEEEAINVQTDMEKYAKNLLGI